MGGGKSGVCELEEWVAHQFLGYVFMCGLSKKWRHYRGCLLGGLEVGFFMSCNHSHALIRSTM